MPNFWTKTVQKISESLSGPRTNDKELEKKMEEMKQYEKGLSILKNIVFNFTKYFEQILSFNREISECIFLLFDKNEEFKDFASSLTSVHMDNNRLFQSVVNEINELNKSTLNWESYYTEAMILYKEREEARKIYDHYEKKLEKLEQKKDELAREGKFNGSSEFSQQVSRNEEKYLKAKEDYVRIATKTYDTINDLNISRFNLVNPVLLQLFFTEMKVYESFSNKYGIYKNLEQNLTDMKIKFINNSKTKNSYNPMAFTKNPYLEDKFNRRQHGREERNLSVKDSEPKIISQSPSNFSSNPGRTNQNQIQSKKVNHIMKKQSFDDFDFEIGKRSQIINNHPKKPLENVSSGWNVNVNNEKPVMIKNNSNNVQNQQVVRYGEVYNEEFANLDNNFFNPNNISQRIETEQSFYHMNQSRLDKYPTFQSVLDAQDDNKSVVSRLTNINPFCIRDGVEGHVDLSHHDNKPSKATNDNNIFWDFTMNNNTQGNSQIENSIYPINYPNNNISYQNQNNQSVTNDIDFNELLGSSKRPFVAPNNSNQVKSMNKIEKKIDPFEGFY